jgi:cobalt transporter subunit CbtA
MVVVLVSGALAGLALFILQHFSVVPLIHSAETYEKAAQEAHSGPQHEDEGWQPENGWERISLTAIATVLSGVGFAAILFGSIALAGKTVDVRSGALLGMAAFVCFNLAPALGLPPRPPGVVVAELHERQIWWAGTAIATAVALWLIAGPGRIWWLRLVGVVCLLLPHLIGAPAATGPDAVPPQLIRRFVIASLATTCMFWLLVGTIGGYLSSRYEADQAESDG